MAGICWRRSPRTAWNDEGAAPHHRHPSPADALAILRALVGNDERLAVRIAGMATARLRGVDQQRSPPPSLVNWTGWRSRRSETGPGGRATATSSRTIASNASPRPSSRTGHPMHQTPLPRWWSMPGRSARPVARMSRRSGGLSRTSWAPGKREGSSHLACLDSAQHRSTTFPLPLGERQEVRVCRPNHEPHERHQGRESLAPSLCQGPPVRLPHPLGGSILYLDCPARRLNVRVV